jgi:hypothetical protein
LTAPASACTLVVGMLPRDKICATPKAVLGFHAAWLPTRNRGRVNSLPASRAMMDVYPADLRSWIARRGGLTTKMIFLHGRELAEIVPPCRTPVRASGKGNGSHPRNEELQSVPKSCSPPP